LWITIFRMKAQVSSLQIFDTVPGKARHSAAANGVYIAAQFIATPLGPLLAAAVGDAICLIEFSDRRMLEYNYQLMRKHFEMPILSRSNDALEQLRAELDGYFRGAQKSFTSALVMRGTPFQERVWHELLRIPYGETISYQELARRVGKPHAVRAAARANGMNRISILVPCHRVVGKDGALTGYGGGVWRKRLLLELERNGALPGAA
jgi:AraC family transcriptional regulator of adaptative response/methylated-DNA-[protein]-cysteine methyltransferase